MKPGIRASCVGRQRIRWAWAPWKHADGLLHMSDGILLVRFGSKPLARYPVERGIYHAAPDDPHDEEGVVYMSEVQRDSGMFIDNLPLKAEKEM